MQIKDYDLQVRLLRSLKKYHINILDGYQTFRLLECLGLENKMYEVQKLFDPLDLKSVKIEKEDKLIR